MTVPRLPFAELPPDAEAQAALRAAVRRAIPRLRATAAAVITAAVALVVAVVWFHLSQGLIPVLALLGPLLLPPLLGSRELRRWSADAQEWRQVDATVGALSVRAPLPQVLLREQNGVIRHLVRVPLPGIAGARLRHDDWSPVWVSERNGVYAIVADDRATMATSARWPGYR